MTFAAGLLAVGLLKAGTGPDPDDVLKQALLKVLASATRAQNYTCVETVERRYFTRAFTSAPPGCPLVLDEWRDPPLALRLSSTDRLRLDVTVANGAEIFSWAGASRFEAGIETVVNAGPIGSGAFGSYLNTIMLRDVKQFRFESHNLVDGYDLMEYSFRVAKSDSHYFIKRGNSYDAAGYFGSIFLDPANGDLVRLRMETIDLSSGIGPCQSETTLQFSKAETGLPFLLPASARQRFADPNGGQVENHTNFSACREYRGESAITFNAPPGSLAGQGGKDAPAEHPPLPAGLSFTLELLDPIDTNSAAAGDLFRARLVQPLRDGKGRTLARAGTLVDGMLRRVQSVVSPPEVYVVLAPRTLWRGEQRVPLAAMRDWSKVVQASRDKRRPRVPILIPYPDEGAGGVFQFSGQTVVVPKGFRSDWRTVTRTR
ncbi:MAG TPA: hypothetical protein VLY04_03755 [Bryobacteraceae bacterium]|nr:hypothetical protein [Bryobacteraceae bacterium]